MPLNRQSLFATQRMSYGLSKSDLVVIALLAAAFYGLTHVAWHAPAVHDGPAIELTASALPRYAAWSLLRMFFAYVCSVVFTIYYARSAAKSPRAAKLMLPVLDVLQSVPILSFLPVVVLSCSVFLSESVAAEVAAIVLIFTSQAWNMTFSYHQSLGTQPRELREAVRVMRLDGWSRFRTLELPHAAIGLIWNSVMSWSAGWYFLMAAESFKVGKLDFRLPGLGSYLAEAVHAGDTHAVLMGLGTLVCIIVCMDQLIWRPLITWSDKFRQGGEDGAASGSWFLDVLGRSALVERICGRVISPVWKRFDAWLSSRSGVPSESPVSRIGPKTARLFSLAIPVAACAGVALVVWAFSRLELDQWRTLSFGLLCTTGRVFLTVLLALLWTVPFGVFIGTRPKLASAVQPVTQVVASIPATALFPLFMVALLAFPGGLNIAAVILMLMATQWYLLFNIIAGVSAVPQELRQTSAMMGLGFADRWRVLHLPSVFPYVVTGAVTACGGAWNASIISERVEVGGKTCSSPGLGSIIAEATASGDNRMLFAATLLLSGSVVLINRFIWGRLYKVAGERYRME